MTLVNFKLTDLKEEARVLGRDLYTHIASRAFLVAYHEVTVDQRNIVKMQLRHGLRHGKDDLFWWRLPDETTLSTRRS